ncbi:MAG: ATP-binding cassette domain-containing protein, partial [Bacteroidota bacterium]
MAAKLRQGELLGLYGPSGAGKTSLLRILAGLTEVDKGYLKVSGEYWLDTDQRINLPPQDRHVGMLFQDYALFPHMSIEENLRFALPQERQIAHIEELIEAMGLKELRHQLPTQLSGGQQQRVALARTLLRRPSLLLLDEPFSALDSELSNQIRTYVYRYHRENQLTTILVSHRVEDMVSLADEVILLVDGEVKQQGKPADVFFPAQKISDRILGR